MRGEVKTVLVSGFPQQIFDLIVEIIFSQRIFIEIKYPASTIRHPASAKLRPAPDPRPRLPTPQAGINEFSITSLFFPFSLMAPSGRVV